MLRCGIVLSGAAKEKCNQFDNVQPCEPIAPCPRAMLWRGSKTAVCCPAAMTHESILLEGQEAGLDRNNGAAMSRKESHPLQFPLDLATGYSRSTRMKIVATPEGLEPPTYWFEANRSIQLSYGVSIWSLLRRSVSNLTSKLPNRACVVASGWLTGQAMCQR